MAKTKKKDPVYLSKTLFLKGLQCHKALYLSKFHSESQEAIFQSSIGVGILAQGLFPGGQEIPYDGLSKESQLPYKERLRSLKRCWAAICLPSILGSTVETLTPVIFRGTVGPRSRNIRSLTFREMPPGTGSFIAQELHSYRLSLDGPRISIAGIPSNQSLH
jgi:hypothetical protein